jgi:hypothetical protein
MAFSTTQLYNLGQIRQNIAQDTGAGIYNTQTGIYDFDQTTFPTAARVNNFINDTIREICSYDFQCLETIRSYPFIHEIDNVQSVYLSGTSISGSSISGNITPYPSDVLNYSWTANNSIADVNSNFSGLNFIGVDGSGNTLPGTSISGSQITATWTGIGYTYQLDADVDKLLNPPVWIAHSNNGLATTANGVFLQNIDFEDMLRMFPIGTINASGTPLFMATSPGLSDSNNNGYSIVFGPTPTQAYSGNTFLLFYKKLHQTMTLDTDVQGCIPLQFQNVIIAMTEAKVFQLSNPERTPAQLDYANRLVKEFRLWDWSQPSKVRMFRDAAYGGGSGGGSAYDSSVWYRVGSLSH